MTATTEEPIISLPGDDVTTYIKQESNSKRAKLGHGLLYNADNESVTCTLAGSLECNKKNNTYFIRSNKRRYTPSLSDRVIGIIEERVGGDYYKMNIFGPHSVLLHNLSFDGATQRKKPNLGPGALVYCRVVSANRGVDAEVSCKVENTGSLERRDWMTDEAMYGELKGGLNFRVSLGLARQLLAPKCVVLQALASEGMKFEICTGVNGVVWVHSEGYENSILISNAIKNSEVMDEDQILGMVKALVKNVKISKS